MTRQLLACEAAERRTETLNGLRLQFLQIGPNGAPAICFLHGGAAHAHWFDRVIPTFADRLHAIALDQRGHGESQWATPPAYAPGDFVRGLLAAPATYHGADPRRSRRALAGSPAGDGRPHARDDSQRRAHRDSRCPPSPDARCAGGVQRRARHVPAPRAVRRLVALALLLGGCAAPPLERPSFAPTDAGQITVPLSRDLILTGMLSLPVSGKPA